MKQRLLSRLTPPVQALLLIALSVFTTMMTLWIQPTSFLAFLRNMLARQPHLLLLNWLPTALTALALAFLLRSVFFGAAASNFFWGALSVINRVKITVRDEPVYPSDITLLKEVADATESYDITYPWFHIAVVILTTAAFAAAGWFLHTRAERSRRERLRRVGGFAASIAVLATLIATLYSSTTLYKSFYCSYFDHISVVYNELGFPYCLCYNFSTYQITRPDTFDRAEAEGYEAETTDLSHLAPNTHVIFIMSEAFSDLTDRDVFAYDETDDPLQHFHALRSSDHAIGGYLTVPNFAGGTANTEFDVLTGMQTTMLSQTNTSAFRTFTRNIDSVLRVFADDGYHTSFIHPGNDWFYNRENVYRWLGAEETFFVDQMENISYKGTWATDASTADFLLERFDAAVAAGETLCNLTVTIQNHMSYTSDKYADAPIAPVRLSDGVSVSEETETMLSVYVEGIRDADAMLGTLTDYFSASDEPVLLVFYGDHLPYFGDERRGYAELGLSIAQGDAADDPLESYRTPYLIWANDAAAQSLDFSAAVDAAALENGATINASYLGAAVLELTGRSGESAWFDFVNEQRRLLPAYRNGIGLTADGTLFRDLPQELQPLIEKVRNWTYYKMKYKTVE